MSSVLLRNNLPQQPNTFVGRESDLYALTQLLRAPHIRLITLLGPGGTGKTRLSLRLGEQHLDTYADGVWFIELETLTDPALVAPALARVLGVSEGSDPIADTVRAYLRDKHMLLIFDNFEQIVSAAEHLADVVRDAPNVQVVTSSREALNIVGEEIYAVSPLPVPDLGALPDLPDLARNPAVAVYVQRATFVQPTFVLTSDNAAAVAAICVRLDGLPLAIELAASRVRQFPPQQMLTAVDSSLRVLTQGGRDRSPRQQTLYGMIAWSYELLSVGEQMLFGRLSVFAGSFTQQAADIVCAIGDDLPITVAEGLESLVHRSLLRKQIQTDQTRFSFLNTVQEYAGYVLARLAPEGEAEDIRAQHSAYFVALAEDANRGLHTREQSLWSARVQHDHPNMRAVLRRLLEQGDLTVLQLSGALGRFWYLGSYYTEGRDWLEKSLALASATTDTTLQSWQARGKCYLGIFMLSQSDYSQALTMLNASLTMYHALSDSIGERLVLNNIGTVNAYLGQYAQALDFYGQSLILARAQQDHIAIARALNNMGNIAYFQGDFIQAEKYYFEALEIDRVYSDSQGIAMHLHNLAMVAVKQGKYAQAIESYAEALLLFRSLKDNRSVAVLLNNMGVAATNQGEYSRATDLLREAQMLSEAVGDKQNLAKVLNNIGALLQIQDRVDDAYALHEEALIIARSIGDNQSIAEILLSHALIAGIRADTVQAHSLLREALTLATTLESTELLVYGLMLWAITVRDTPAISLWAVAHTTAQAIRLQPDSYIQRPYDQAVTELRAEVGEAVWHAEWANGEARLLTAVIAELVEP